MPGCCVKDCNNRSERGFRLFRVPTGTKNIERRQKWLQLIGRNILPQRAEICEVHFDENQFEKNRADGRKLLYPFAIPNLLYKDAIENDNMDTEEENNSKKVKYSTNDDEHEGNTNNLNKNVCSNVNNGDNVIAELEIGSADHGVNESGHSKITSVIMRDIASNEKLDEKIKNYEEDIKKLKKSLNKAVVEYSVLKRKLQKRNKKFNQIFNEG